MRKFKCLSKGDPIAWFLTPGKIYTSDTRGYMIDDGGAKFLRFHWGEWEEVFDKPEPKTEACTCGAKFTSFPNIHLTYCKG